MFLVNAKKDTFKIWYEDKINFQQFKSYYQTQLINIINKKEVISSVFGVNVKLSETSLSSVPYLSDNKLSKMIGEIYSITNFITINLSTFRSMGLLQYHYPEKFKILLDKLRKEIYKEIAISEAINYEKSANYKSFKPLQMRSVYNVQNSISKRSFPLLFLKLDPSMSDQNLQKIINIAIESNLIDGLVVDGTLKADKGLVVGEKNKEYAINQLKRIKQLSEGKLSLISTGGVLTGRDVYERVKAGASLVTIYSAFLKEVRRS